MKKFDIAKILLSELTTLKARARITEPDLVMDDADQVEAFAHAGREGGTLAPLYLFHSAMICELARPGDFVVDLACGPANQLGQVARLNPESRFLGIDLAPSMLEQARALVRHRDLGNVDFKLGDITQLSFLESQSVDVVMSTLSMHHLPDLIALRRTFSEIHRVLKPDGAVYISDFGKLKSERSIDLFATQYADAQPEVFTQDHLNSMHAAFPVEAFQEAASPLAERVAVLHTFLVPYMVVVKSKARRELGENLRRTLSGMAAQLSAHQRSDLRSLRQFFGIGGVRTQALG